MHLLKKDLQGFDDKFSGLACGELLVVGGRPGMGKTQILVQLTLELSKTTQGLVEHIMAKNRTGSMLSI